MGLIDGLIDYSRQQEALEGVKNWANEQFGQSNPALASLAQKDPMAFREMLPKLLERKMAQDAITAATQQQSPLAQISGVEGAQGPISIGGEQPQMSALERVYAQLNPTEYSKWATEEKPKRVLELETKERERQTGINTLQRGYEETMASFQNMIGTPEEKMGGLIGRAYKRATPATTGRWGILGKLTAGPESTALASDLAAIEANQIIDQMTKMKELSKTGATGFGATNEKELEALKSKVRNLNQSQSDVDLKNNLSELNDFLIGSRERINKSYQEDMKKFGISTQIPQPSALGQLTKPKITPEMARAELIKRKGGQ